MTDILAQLLAIKGVCDFREDYGGAILDRADDTESYSAAHPAQGAIASSRLVFEALVTFDLTLAQGAWRPAHALGFVRSARPEQGKPLEDRFILSLLIASATSVDNMLGKGP